MAWAKGTSGTNANTSPTTSIAATSGSAVSVGDTVCVALTYGDNGTAPSSGSVADNLGNTYVKKGTARDAGNLQSVEVWYSVITSAGTPTVTAQFNPTPGTTQAQGASICVDPFTGSNASSTGDGTGQGLFQGGPASGTDVINSGTGFTTATDGDLIYGCTCETSVGNDAATTGSGETLGSVSAAVVVRSAFKTQTTHGTGTQITFSTTTASVNWVTAALAVTPAAGGTDTLMGQACL